MGISFKSPDLILSMKVYHIPYYQFDRQYPALEQWGGITILAIKMKFTLLKLTDKNKFSYIILITCAKIPVIDEFFFLPPLILHVSLHYIPVPRHISSAILQKIPVHFAKKPGQKIV